MLSHVAPAGQGGNVRSDSLDAIVTVPQDDHAPPLAVLPVVGDAAPGRGPHPEQDR